MEFENTLVSQSTEIEKAEFYKKTFIVFNEYEIWEILEFYL